MAATTHVLVVSDGPVGSRMAAPGIRAFHIARTLHERVPDTRITLAVPSGPRSDVDPSAHPFETVVADSGEVAELAAPADIIVAGRLPVSVLARTLGRRIVLDLYTPHVTEWANMMRYLGKNHRRAALDARRKHLLLELSAADLVLCANGRQRDFFAGVMGTMGMITPDDFDADPTMRSRIAIASLGIRPHEPPPRSGAIRRAFPAIRESDTVLLWNGTIIEWYDVDTLLRALRTVCEERDDVKLVFLGTDYPQAKEGAGGSIGAGAVRDAVELARELDLLDRHVFFNHGWADDATSEAFLADADAAISTYFDNLETHYSFRVRYLDQIWASLPMICTRGDEVAEMVERRSLGVTVPAKDQAALAAAIRRMADPAAREAFRSNLRIVREEFRWERTLRPLIDFCSQAEARGEKAARVFPLAYRTADWFVAEAHEKVRFAYRKKLLRQGHSGLR
jgi:glycosyltransferase involved in cell wall biosynthesis